MLVILPKRVILRQNLKNMVFKYLIVILIVAGIQACNPSDYRDPSNRCEWYVTNLTKDSLVIQATFSYEPVVLVHDTTILIDHTAFQKDDNECFFQGIYNFNTIDDSVVVCNMKGDILIVWKESQRNDSGKQFFNEKYWEKREWEDGKYTYHEWTFELLPEDVKVKAQDELFY